MFDSWTEMEGERVRRREKEIMGERGEKGREKEIERRENVR